MSVLARMLEGKRVVICAGAGGVGKTTVSAAIALGLAARGRRVALVTIDPARRLAEALGLSELGNEPRLLDPERFGSTDIRMDGELWAMMLDVKRTFDELIGHLAPSTRVREEILANRVYRHISTAVAGSQEYAAIAKLFEIEQEGDYEAIVLDTPPSRNALDFLNAPSQLTTFLEGRAFSAFILPARGATRAASLVLATLGRAIGAELLTDLATFFRLISELSGGLRERARSVQSLLHDPGTAFLVIASPERSAVTEAIFFAEELARAGMHRSGLIMNRVHPLDVAGQDATETAALAQALGPHLASTVLRTHSEVQLLARRDASAIDRLRRALAVPEPILLPDRESEVRDLGGLADICRELFHEPP